MSTTELERVKQDIATIKQAAGFDLPFGWDYVWLHLFGLPAMGVWFLAYWLISDTPSPYVMGVPLFLLPAVLGYLRFKHRRSTGSSAIKRREYGVNFYASVFLAVAMLVLATWAKRVGIDTNLASIVITMLGLIRTVIAFLDEKRISYLGSSIPFILFGISIAIWPSRDTIIWGFLITLLVAGPATAFIMMYQLKQAGQINDTH